MPYTTVFGGSTIYPSQVSFLSIELTADQTLEWPLQNSGPDQPASRIIDVDPDQNGWAITLPDATQTSPGQTVLFNNISGSYSFEVLNGDGGTLAVIDAGEQWQLYLAAVADAGGTWRVFMFGASTASVQPSQLAGYGLIPTGATLSQSLPVTTFSLSGTTLSETNRAALYVWDGTGAGTVNLPLVGDVDNNYFVMLRNGGGGDLTIDPNGSETIDGAATLILRPGDSAIVATDGTEWYTVGYGQQSVFAFDYTAIAVSGGNYTLAGSELNRIAYNFTGVLSSDSTIIVPSTVQQYWISNNTTGPYDMYVKTATGSPVQINQGAKGIYYSNGTDIILGSDPVSIATPLVISDGGTGATTASAARLNLGITAFADTIVTATTGATVRTAISAAASGANNDITSLSGLTTPLSVAQGGTGAATLTGYVKGAGTSALTASATIPVGDLSGTLGAAAGGTGLTSYAIGDIIYASGATTLAKLADVATGSALLSGGVGVAPSWGQIGLTTHVTGVLPVANGGTNAATAADARTSLGAQETLVSGTNIKTVNGNSLLGSGNVDLTTGEMPSGTKMLFIQTAAPTGWTKDTTHNDKALRVVSGSASSGGSVAFTTAFSTSRSVSGSVGSTTLTESQIPSHDHFVAVNSVGNNTLSASNSVAVESNDGGDSQYILNSTGSSGATIGLTSTAGSGGSHTHSWSGSVNVGVQYIDTIIATKD